MDPVVNIGEQAPQFILSDLDGKDYSLSAFRGWIVVLVFWSAECTWSERVDKEIAAYLDSWRGKVKVWWIASNANEPRAMIETAAAKRHLATVLMDNMHQVADLYGAQTTPHFFVVNDEGRLAYQGAWDDITFRQRSASRAYVPEAVR